MASIDFSQLRGLIGTQVRFSDMNWEVIEIIEHGPELVLQSLSTDSDRHIQSNQYGDAHRKVPRTLSIPVIDPISGGFHALFVETGLHHRIESKN